ncbi:DUF5694 domain-containing protein [Luteimonas vadosa]
MKKILLVLLVSLTALAQASEPAQVMIVGTYHFSNPGQDIHNVEAADVSTPARQAEIARVVSALQGFAPTLVAVEWPRPQADERYARYLDGTLPPSDNEVVQLGFRLASAAGLERVHGIDVKGAFPFGPVHAWAEANGRGAELAGLQARAQAEIARFAALQAEHSIGTVLHAMNQPGAISESHALYAALLRFGDDDVQPGVELNAAWEQRNLAICARLLQALRPGSRAVAFFGHGHVYLLRRCVVEAPGVELVEAIDYLPRE